MLYARKGCSCSQAVACAFADAYGLDKSLLLGMSSGLAGGMSGAGEVCGVVTAGIVVLGALFGPKSIQDSERREHVMQLSHEFLVAFGHKNGSTLCRELNGGVDLHSAAGKLALRESGKPMKLIASGTHLLADLISREDEKVVTHQ
ncbi:C-GCAxxG-C-C family protein [Pseudodesulfovibrio sp. zrk46]|uniref:C-GCAxxG-C-C family protein n=1 Tax=Pseudodesulfovibrio sp. zrk46 TaxID=2725288 RepID=UPI001449DCEF|nr:C-GCAxxG-C-C family protein [Pseudodesulfovibrio sp. zrk46]QJB58191.1 C_GCAxxG_C_C family protein [Pseudodesulfovibrio sp. zrk46]